MPKRLFFPRGRNNLVATLSDADRAAIERYLTPVDLDRTTVLEDPGKPIGRVYFPFEGVGSIVASGHDDRRIEVGLFGREGMSGTAVVLDGDVSPHETFMQVSGHGLAIEAGRLRDAMEARPSLRRHFLRYVQSLLTQTTHTALSNGRAKLEERLARWLLMCHDRIDGDTLELTHEFLSVMLGVRRAGVTVGTHILEGNGLIRASRGQITILDREGLEAEAHQSYGVPEDEYARLFP